ncbi:MAG: sialidase family protein [Akkermansiaceae bacterium]|nr:sialidase family protein [Akkermansiaceae bacterium]
MLRLRDGRLLMSYGYRRKPFGNQARLSEDGGTTWSEPIMISGDGVSGDLGYPSTVELVAGHECYFKGASMNGHISSG